MPGCILPTLWCLAMVYHCTSTITIRCVLVWSILCFCVCVFSEVVGMCSDVPVYFWLLGRVLGGDTSVARPACGNSFMCPTRSGTTEIYIYGPAGAGIQNKICNIHLIDIVLQLQKYLEVQVFLVLQKYLEYQKQWNCSKLSERDTDMQNNIVKLRQRVRQG